MDSEGEEAFEALFRAEYPSVVRAVRRIVGSSEVAEEISQEAFCRAFERWNKVRAHERPAAWIRLVALRMAIRSDLRRRRGDALRPSWSTLSEPVADLDLQHAIDSLSDRQRTAVVLHYMLDLSISEVSAVMQVSEGTIKTQLHRARSRLAATLETQEDVDDATR